MITGEAIQPMYGLVSGILTSFSPIIALVIGIPLGFWILGRLFGFLGDLLERRADEREFLRYSKVLEAAGYAMVQRTGLKGSVEEALAFMKARDIIPVRGAPPPVKATPAKGRGVKLKVETE